MRYFARFSVGFAVLLAILNAMWARTRRTAGVRRARHQSAASRLSARPARTGPRWCGLAIMIGGSIYPLDVCAHGRQRPADHGPGHAVLGHERWHRARRGLHSARAAVALVTLGTAPRLFALRPGRAKAFRVLRSRERSRHARSFRRMRPLALQCSPWPGATVFCALDSRFSAFARTPDSIP